MSHPGFGFLGWRDAPIRLKFSLAIGSLLTITVLLAATGYTSLSLVRTRMESDILAAMEIRRLAMEMESGLYRARQLERDFFLRWPRTGFAQAYETHALKSLEQVAAVVSTNRRLQERINQSDVSLALRQQITHLNFYLSAADRYAQTFDEALELIAALAREDTGLQSKLARVSQGLIQALSEEVDPHALLLFREVQVLEKEYLVTRQRPVLQSAFNVLAKLRTAMDDSRIMEEGKRWFVLTLLQDYRATAEAILALDRELRSKFNEFDLQMDALTPISARLVDQANQEVAQARRDIERIGRLASLFLAGTMGLAMTLAAAVIVVVNRSITNNVAGLARAADALRSGDLTARAPVASGDEIGSLAEMFNAMAARIGTLMEDLEDRATLAHVRLFEAIDSINEGFMLFDPQDRLAVFNKIVRSMLMEFGIDIAQGVLIQDVFKNCVQQSFFHPSHGIDQDLINTLFQTYSQAQASNEWLLGNNRWLKISSTKTRKGETVYILEDISRRKRLEEQRLESERRLLHSQKLESLGILAGGIAHDFNNLLAAMQGNLELALEKLPLHSPARTRIDQALMAARRATELTRQMLAYSGKGQFVVQDVFLSELMEQNISMFQTIIAKTISLEIELTPNLPAIAADIGQIQQVVMNLITNASEAFGDKPGTMVLATGLMDCDDHYLSQSRIEEKPRAGRFAWLEVADTGMGMDEETKARLFDPFFSTKFTGRGLGMSAVLGIIRGHNGAIVVHSDPGRGSTIRVLFPIPEAGTVTPRGIPVDAQAPSTNVAPLTSMKPLRQRLVLVVDDEQIVRELCEEALQHLGHKVLSAADGVEALKVFQENIQKIDCVLLDLMMPRMDGVAAFAEIRRLRPGIRVILCSGYNEQEATQRFHGQGLAGFLQKPFRIEDLRLELERVFRAS